MPRSRYGRSSSPAAARPRPAASRSSSSHTASSRWAQGSAQTQHAAPPPAPSPKPVSPAVSDPRYGGGMMTGLMGAVAQGAALGTGSAIAHRAVGSVFDSHGEAPASATSQPPQPVMPQVSSFNDPCGAHVKAFAECMSSSNGDMALCSNYFELMQQCKLNA